MEAWRLKHERDKVARGYLVSVKGENGEHIWGAFPDTSRGKSEAQLLAAELAQDSRLPDEVRADIGDPIRAVIYTFEHDQVEIIDYIWTDAVLARPKKIVKVSAISPEEEDG